MNTLKKKALALVLASALALGGTAWAFNLGTSSASWAAGSSSPPLQAHQ